MSGDTAGRCGLTTKQAAQVIGVSEWSVKVWIRHGILPQALPGRAQRILPEDLFAAQRRAHIGDVAPRWRADPVRAGQRLRALREVAGLNQLQRAARAGLTHEQVCRIKHGSYAAMTATILRLAEALATGPAQFVSDDPIGLRTVSVPKAAAQLGIPLDRLQRWIREGALPGTKLAGRWRIPAVAVDDLNRSGRLRGASRRLDG